MQIVEDCEERFSGEQLDDLLQLIETHLGSSRPDQGEEDGEEDGEEGAVEVEEEVEEEIEEAATNGIEAEEEEADVNEAQAGQYTQHTGEDELMDEPGWGRGGDDEGDDD